MRVIAIDFDGTAYDYPDKVNQLFDNQENLIIIHTARPEYLRRETEKQLEERGINYHALKMGKLRADVYIDDKNAGGLRWPVYPIKNYTDKVAEKIDGNALNLDDINKMKKAIPKAMQNGKTTGIRKCKS